MRELIVSEHEAGQRLDRLLRKLLPGLPLGAIFKHLRNGAIRIDGRKAGGELRLERGMRVQLDLPDVDRLLTPGAALPPTGGKATGGKATGARGDRATDRTDRTDRADRAAPDARAPHARAPGARGTPTRAAAGAHAQEQPEPRIVHRDEHLLVVAKPAGLAVHGGSGIDYSIVDWLARQPFGVRTATWKPAPAHRLDRGTSGLLLIGLVPAALRELTAAFRAGDVHKVYHAVVHGVPKPARGTIAAKLRVHARASRAEPKVVVAPDGQSARTDYEVLRNDRQLALVRVVPHDGRQHQIRVHLAHLGHPIVGDRRYGSPADTGRSFHLHCSELAFVHPGTRERIVLTEPVPATFTRLIATG